MFKKKYLQNFILSIINIFFYCIFKLLNINVLNNHLIGTVGHSAIEINYFFLLKRSKKIKKKNYILFLDNSQICRDLKIMFDGKIRIIVNTTLNTIIKKFLQKNSEFGLDIGVSHFLNVEENKIKGFGIGMRDWKEGFNRDQDYWHLKNDYKDYFAYQNLNIDEEKKDELLEKLNINVNKKIALIHIKTKIGNACAKVTDPYTYIKTIEFLIENHFQIIFVGREIMPNIFRKYSIINYANSKFTSWMNDVILTEKSDFFLCFGSGLAQLPSVMNKSCLYVGFWHVFSPISNQRSIFIPSILKNKNNGEFLKFAEQTEYAHKIRMQHFSSELYEVINPDKDDLLNGTKELLDLYNNKKIDNGQINFKKKLNLQKCESNISKFFLEKYTYLC
jgi:putative glycosyltransferase (TIGR04372 family)|tara:strand:+ start:102 stop:1271 length:1170 start_codon:yes stop_codon:yes gene_type:complete